MARYYFDIHDGQWLTRDDVGFDCDGQEAIRTEAMQVLPAIARDGVPKDGNRQAFTVLVRNEDNLTVYTATMTFAGLWLGEEVPPAMGAEANSLD
ncbi:DUF6894 family protein [Methylobacterium frigidaeris]|uniref:DUF6894 domain-containing protein n=1 Tax=Methylobacterium frigidaeris TaxID=2038277 RepID=A0AA37M7V2_9HYPH|nr:hypothetical protein [Methylobacterium frigidaeris]PIK69060.1 hypothetical protein CS379_31800 [Methylobacterium frigidaeris]GJD66325.1 hypothetical protein MPEAHAMD_6522 [Methylobacterium frigidaeris]